jgi:hypothetical protein
LTPTTVLVLPSNAAFWVPASATEKDSGKSDFENATAIFVSRTA